jgi:hypothetical protein
MNTYKILARLVPDDNLNTIIVRASSLEEAISKVKEEYKDSEVEQTYKDNNIIIL